MKKIIVVLLSVLVVSLGLTLWGLHDLESKSSNIINEEVYNRSDEDVFGYDKPLTESIFYSLLGLDDIRYCDYLIDNQAYKCKRDYEEYKLGFEIGIYKIVDNNSRFTDDLGLIDYTIYWPDKWFMDYEVLGRFYMEIIKVNDKYEWSDVTFDY